VTVFGESAGAAAVGTLLGMPASTGLFRRAIMQSGTAERYRSAGESSRISLEFLELCGLDLAGAGELLTLPVERLLEAAGEAGPAGWGRNIRRPAAFPANCWPAKGSRFAGLAGVRVQP
jgi:para-nitrobenzyl esterase